MELIIIELVTAANSSLKSKLNKTDGLISPPNLQKIFL